MKLPNNLTGNFDHKRSPHFSHDMNCTNTQLIKRKYAHRLPKRPPCVSQNGQKRVPTTGSARKAPLQCQIQQSRSYVNASANSLIGCKSEFKTELGPKSFFWVRQIFYFFMTPQMGFTLWISFWSLHFFPCNVCRMREQLSQIDHSDPISKIAF